MPKRKITMKFPLSGDPYLEDTEGFGSTCEEHIEEVARAAGAEATLVCPLPDLESNPEVEDNNVDHIKNS
jgi:predicted xylose isomerase-like sugar epimerase